MYKQKNVMLHVEIVQMIKNRCCLSCMLNVAYQQKKSLKIPNVSKIRRNPCVNFDKWLYITSDEIRFDASQISTFNEKNEV